MFWVSPEKVWSPEFNELVSVPNTIAVPVAKVALVEYQSFKLLASVAL